MVGQQCAPLEGLGLAAAQARGAQCGCGVFQLLGQADVCLQGDSGSALLVAPCEVFLGHKPEGHHLTQDLSS